MADDAQVGGIEGDFLELDDQGGGHEQQGSGQVGEGEEEHVGPRVQVAGDAGRGDEHLAHDDEEGGEDVGGLGRRGGGVVLAAQVHEDEGAEQGSEGARLDAEEAEHGSPKIEEAEKASGASPMD